MTGDRALLVLWMENTNVASLAVFLVIFILNAFLTLLFALLHSCQGLVAHFPAHSSGIQLSSTRVIQFVYHLTTPVNYGAVFSRDYFFIPWLTLSRGECWSIFPAKLEISLASSVVVFFFFCFALVTPILKNDNTWGLGNTDSATDIPSLVHPSYYWGSHLIV